MASHVVMQADFDRKTLLADWTPVSIYAFMNIHMLLIVESGVQHFSADSTLVLDLSIRQILPLGVPVGHRPLKNNIRLYVSMQ